ncbi:hypothetical protein [Bacillus massilinigeriensis]|uniref:hypothetical protein n=1 Tax=Bacillus mediterraneensis TaxID=1805474 RepID=UPI000A5A3AD5|nr:hypothetical protein [Bacillus mediterraneensis]
MTYIMVGLLVLAVVLFILSFFLKEPYGEIREEIDQLTIQQAQELFQMKKKMKVLEEELLVVPEIMNAKQQKGSGTNEINSIIKNQVWSLRKQGKSLEQIALQSSLTTEEVSQILREFSERGQA